MSERVHQPRVLLDALEAHLELAALGALDELLDLAREGEEGGGHVFCRIDDERGPVAIFAEHEFFEVGANHLHGIQRRIEVRAQAHQ